MFRSQIYIKYIPFHFRYGLLLCLFLFAACEEDKPVPVTPEPELPPYTETGENTFGFTVNGNVYSFSDDPQDRSNFNFTVDPVEDRVTIGCSTDPFSPGRGWELTWDIDKGANRGDTGVFQISEEWVNAYFNEARDYFRTRDFQQGELYIRKWDRFNGIISGTFFFDALSQSGDSLIEVRDGRFDIYY